MSVFIGFSCTNSNETNRLMNQAEQLLVLQPDSAQALLNAAELRLSTNRDFARWCLLSGRAEDERRKKYSLKRLLPLSDWVRAKAYYDSHGTLEEKASIRLYLGRSQNENKLYDAAATTYKEGLEYAQSANAYSLAGYLCSYLGDLYYDKTFFQEAQEKYKEAAGLHERAGNTRSQTLALRDLSFCYMEEAMYDEALSTLQKADSLAENIQDPLVRSTIVNVWGILYREIGNLDLAERYYLQSIDLDSLDKGTVYYNLSRLYTQKEDHPKARAYLDSALSTLAKDAVFYQHYLIKKAEQNHDSALFYLEQYFEVFDSITVEQNRINVLEIESKYDHSRLANEKNRLLLRQQQFVIGGLILLLFLFVAFVYYRNFKNTQLRKQQEDLAQKESEYLMLSLQLNEKDQLLDEHEEASEKYVQQKQQLSERGIALFNKKQILLRQSVIGQKIIRISRNGISSQSTLMTEDDWDALETKIKQLFPDRYIFIKKHTSTRSLDFYRLALISFFQFDTNVEAFLLNKTVDTIRQNRTRLRKLFGMKSSEHLFSFYQNYNPSIFE